MEQVRNLGDERQLASCVYCGGSPGTRDHVPSLVLLDEPYPENLPVVPACVSCNGRFSSDEEYVACLVECTLAGSARPEAVRRERIKRKLASKPALAARLEDARRQAKGGIRFEVELDRVRNVILKLARGHAAFELNEPRFEKPDSVTIRPIPTLSHEDLDRFETPPPSSIWPEVGSRAMQRLVRSSGMEALGWILVQPEQYRYLASVGEAVIVRSVIGEYLASEVVWR